MRRVPILDFSKAEFLTDEDDILTLSGIDDIVLAMGGDDIVYGGSGYDFLFGMDGDDELHGERGNDYLDGGEGDDSIYGGEDNDWIIGGPGNDSLSGGNGNDTLMGGVGQNILFGGAGIDTATYENMDQGYLIDLDAGFAHVAGLRPLADGAMHVGDTLTGIENVIGTQFGDRIFGDQYGNRLEGLGGSDLIYGGDGNDTIDPGAGNDIVEGGAGNDVIMLGTGRQEIHGGGDYDTLSLFNFQDGAGFIVQLQEGTVLRRHGSHLETAEAELSSIENVRGSGGDDAMYGSEQNDRFTGGGGWDVMAGRGGNDTLYIYEGEGGIMSGGRGEDILWMGDTAEFVQMTGGQDADLFRFHGMDPDVRRLPAVTESGDLEIEGNSIAEGDTPGYADYDVVLGERGRIMDFEASEGDQIQITGASGQAVEFAGYDDFVGNGRDSFVVFDRPREDLQLVVVDADGDKEADWYITVHVADGHPMLTEADFLF